MRHVSTVLVQIVGLAIILSQCLGTAQVQATVTDTSLYSKEYFLGSDGQGTFFRNKRVCFTGTELQVLFSTPLMMHPSHKHSASSYFEGYMSGFSTVLKMQQMQIHQSRSKQLKLVKQILHLHSFFFYYYDFALLFKHYLCIIMLSTALVLFH